ncbi:MAG: quinol dehydrogenase ferredoxin subunit NapH [Hydrogenothermaceae bacterium]
MENVIEHNEEKKGSILHRYKYLFLRRFTQITILVLYIGGNVYSWKILQGNLSSSKIMNVIPMADPYAVLQIFATGSLVAIDTLIGALIVLFFYAVIGGRAFCAWVCPMNMITDLANWIRRKFKLDKDEYHPLTISRNVRYWILAVSFVISAFVMTPAFEMVNPISMLHRGLIFGMGFGWTVVAAVFFFDLFVVKNGWCGHLCPLGAFYSIIGKKSLIRVYHNHDKCTLCMECKAVCPEKPVLHMVGKDGFNSFVNSGACINCGRCIEVCPADALSFKFRLKNPQKEEKNHV